MQNVDDLNNTILEIQSIFNSTVISVFNDLTHASNTLDPIINSQNTITQKLNETLEFLNSGVVIGLKGDNGESAYELALQSGFTGTLQEWLNSLHGGSTTVQSPLISIKKYTTLTQSSNQTTKVPFFSIPLNPNRFYEIVVNIAYRSTATTNGLVLDYRHFSQTLGSFEIEIPITQLQASTALSRFGVGYDSYMVTEVKATGVNTANANQPAFIRGTVIVDANAENPYIQFYFASEIAGQTVSIMDWSHVIVKEYELTL